MTSVHSFTFNPFQENTFVVFDETREAVVIDPGCSDRSEQNALEKFISAEKLTIKYLLNTHCHIDHVLGNAFVKDKYKVKLFIHRIEETQLRAVKSYAGNYGFHQYQESTADEFIDQGDVISFGNTRLDVLFLPGHSAGHIGFYHPVQRILLSGDVLFEGSIGRTDLPGGDFDTLIQSIHQKLFVLPDDVVVYPGHGPTTTIGEEKISNPFCALSLS